MTRFHRQLLVATISILLCSITLAQNTPSRTSPRLLSARPTIVSIAYLSTHPREMDGQLVSVRAWLQFGWEGDNFMWDEPRVAASTASDARPSLWFHVDPAYERRVFGVLPSNLPVVGTFTGFFHFVPDKKSRTNEMFDPGPLQFSVITVSDLKMPGS